MSGSGYARFPWGFSNVGALDLSISDSTYLPRDGSGRGLVIVPQYSSYCSGCNCDDRCFGGHWGGSSFPGFPLEYAKNTRR
ncbi:hypothetical protein AVEN_148568-1 [Araneus ventricosus]|uniref:Uncharacterized protein n=1 Tax=Araneus ventricosus TaxID=182803 RepID=A0A4Y2U8H6_ARAVE|nr:hypothetical protein AVEN_148568-1 [Araneus ventricosus]